MLLLIWNDIKEVVMLLTVWNVITYAICNYLTIDDEEKPKNMIR